ncbi:putative L-ribulose-5-phosphate 4-epimerase [Treponema socranskii subsp. socranskii VPI DR56BR1116 = ATCC 35536]|uniref:L-ribulose-5-phosphate 4-epimerase n=1 Tax=Treponema socranskii subsp. socranskii VPI DR56BR1116 = ATCC 35536 TaxID=1125725 RepID=U2LFY6_TRESO|nr:class II aldolase/adducin family protein [Treponema socranskii]ERF60583.1 putative L-ribulose-5-phosphate 4-epimerase [Treponema socranskii subsp. socranskii VPI DR56BR1116 = ATCC 35536]ERK03201.1 putative L-ribulose-5-phosphate 4-epimerase [Treponema socranskii subsp. socranskii VPI DR56BR1116 = ATCC 35536]
MYREFLKAKNEFLQAAARTYESGIQTGTGGNLSVRIPGTDLMIVKPSGYSYGQCNEENLTVTDFEGNLQEGTYKPTRESTLHGNLYKRYANIGGIVHTHSPYAILISLNFDELPLVTMHSQLKLKKPVQCIDVKTQAVTEDELPKVFAVMDSDPETAAFILKGHGIVAVASNPVKAGQIAELIEETAQIAWEQMK